MSDFDSSEKPIRRKHDHTLRVVENSKRIAEDIGLPRQDIELAEMIGLFHDIGRFEQWQIYHNFHDYETTDHAELGIKIIKENGILAEYNHYDIFISAIKNHNKFEIDPKITDDRELTFCKIIRDADKLDIIREFLTGELQFEKTDRNYSRKVLKDVMRRRLVDRAHINNEADHALAELALFNDINFEYTKRCIKKDALIEKMINLLIEANSRQKETLRQVEETIKLYY